MSANANANASIHTDSRDEIDRFYEENPDPSRQQIAERLLPLAARRIIRAEADGYNGKDAVDDLSEFTALIHDSYIAEGLTLHQAAAIAIPLVYDLLTEQDRVPQMKAWMTSCFFDHGFDRDRAVEILKAHQQQGGQAA